MAQQKDATITEKADRIRDSVKISISPCKDEDVGKKRSISHDAIDNIWS